MTPLVEAEPVRVLLVESSDEDSSRVMAMSRDTANTRFRLRRIRRFRDARRLFQTGRADVLLLGLSLQDGWGLDAVREVQNTMHGVPLVVLSDKPDEAMATEALRQGAQDFLVKSELTPGRLAQAVTYSIVRHRVQASFRMLSLRDELTGLHNRRGFLTLAEQQLRRTNHRGLHSSLVFGDLDDLKRVNDTFGHREGDRALQATARIFLECFRESDIVARLGGDEFCALCVDAPGSSQGTICDRLAAALETHNAQATCQYRLSISIGIVEMVGGTAIEHQLDRADALMYAEKRGKRLGGNPVVTLKEQLTTYLANGSEPALSSISAVRTLNNAAQQATSSRRRVTAISK